MVAVSACDGIMRSSDLAAYDASKQALIALVEAARELGLRRPRKRRLAGIHPGSRRALGGRNRRSPRATAVQTVDDATGDRERVSVPLF
ncbi:hypothetical protein D8S78_23485 [Natrialba swarupiae]|nr:hypothetical protein [Natrialba swarupiae]